MLPRFFTGLLLTAPSLAAAEPKLDFNRDVRPVLTDKCFRCHGPDERERKAKLRLDQPGWEAKDVITRISSTDPEERMPPPESKKSLSPGEAATLRRWIDEGAPYAKHWAFVPPVRPPVPVIPDSSSPVINPIDAFAFQKLHAAGLRPQPQADRERLLRRVTLDLTGLPPPLEELDAFLKSPSPQAYDEAVERLLAAPALGERLALHWLDLARYADTHGYHLDSGREMWAWRDWVIAAFNRNQRFDQFVTEQLAGDLMPQAARDQVLATGFVRNNMINFEGGAIAEEYLNAYLVDRVTTVSTVFLGLTMHCCQCHDHKYDPLTMRDFYSLYAYFNAVPEKGLDGNKGNAEPVIPLPAPEKEQEIAALEAEMKAAGPNTPAADGPKKKIEALRRSIPTVMVMRDMGQPRDTFILTRGAYDAPGAKVQPAVPAALGTLPQGAPSNRLALAQWLTSPEHPLLARVTVNRLWAMLFGNGLVKTVNDFGLQGEWPSHPELLDWLAVEFRESGWDVKRLMRLIVTSHTYRQSAAVTPALLERDPDNRLLSRGSRSRLPAEHLRDLALRVSGLLNPKIGGPSVFPYQPAGLWEELSKREDSKNWTGQSYTPSHGADLYRRGMYTYWKRTCPPPSLITFDAPDREVCTAQRSTTTTPLQALVTLNDPVFVEAARVFAERILKQGGHSTEERLTFAFRLCTARRPAPAELTALTALHAAQSARFRAHPEEASGLLSAGEHPRDPALEAAELAAWAGTAAVLLNLDETLCR